MTIKNRTACFINGEISLGSTCSNTVGIPTTNQQTTQQTLEFLEVSPAHPPAVFQSADDYGEETLELEEACRLLGKDCSYALKSTISTHHEILRALNALKTQ